ncbi:MAG: RNA recognition motif domain containing protein [Microgenomates bacterium OLB22]|nr:MAG: RNA recognition motif domain containing protein [Microgenomates bacterium OLB22]
MTKKLFVGGLSWDTTDESLHNFFSQIGAVESAVVLRDRFNGRSRGYGFVEFTTEEDAQRAIDELNEKELDGRAIRVSEAKPQEPRENRGGNFSSYRRNDRNDSRGYNDRDAS